MTSPLLDRLPAIYRSDPFLGKAILAFERILLGRIDHSDIQFSDQGLEEKIDNISTLFDPQQTPSEFLHWLAGWAALTLRADLPEQVQRRFIANAVLNYQYRGTKASLQRLMELYLLATPTVIESATKAHFFSVRLAFPTNFQGEVGGLDRQISIARSIIDHEKPAHTDYELDLHFPSLQIEVTSTIGINTLLGTIEETTLEGDISSGGDMPSGGDTIPEV